MLWHKIDWNDRLDKAEDQLLRSKIAPSAYRGSMHKQMYATMIDPSWDWHTCAVGQELRLWDTLDDDRACVDNVKLGERMRYMPELHQEGCDFCTRLSNDDVDGARKALENIRKIIRKEGGAEKVRELVLGHAG